jgi:hypothetical protein
MALCWSCDGESLTGVTPEGVINFSDITGQHFIFPIKFSQIQVTGNYSFSQRCALYDGYGKELNSTTGTGQGTIAETIANGTIHYVVQVKTGLELIEVDVVNGSRSTDIHPDNGGLPDWLASIVNFFSSVQGDAGLRTSIQDVFLNADFSQTMIDALNKKLGG